MFTLIRTTAITFTALTLLWAAGLMGFNVHVKGLPPPEDTSAEAVIVLTGGPDRINAGLDLLAEKKAKHLFISGVNTKVSAKQLISLWREDMRKPPCCIVLGHEAQNTFENAAEAKDWIEINNIKSALILTENYHMPRAWLEFTAVMPQIDLRPHVIIPNSTGRFFALHEYNKTIFTLLRLKLTKEGT